MTAGNAAKLDRRKDICARKKVLAGDDEEILRQKRARIEARLNLAAYGNLLEFATIDPATGKLTAIDWRKVAESDLAVIVSEFAFDSKTGELTKFKRDDALNAAAQLRDMLGFKAATRVENANTGELIVKLVRFSDDDGPPVVREPPGSKNEGGRT
jgi:hypothetical protein